jgi:CRISPR-associated protein Cmr1
MMEDPHEYRLKALTSIWTGRANRQGDRLITTGLLGSIRWWFEVLVRGLGGSACDPTRDSNRCPGHRKKPTDPGHRCVVCELFGCTGWARKFRFEVLDENGEFKAAQIKNGETFKLRFTPLRAVRDEEWALLDLTLRLIAKYGALGGKTKLRKRNDGIGRRPDRGLGQVRVESPSDLASSTWQEISNHLHESRWHRPNHKGFEWAAADKLEALPKEHRGPEALLQHLRSDSSGGK